MYNTYRYRYAYVVLTELGVEHVSMCIMIPAHTGVCTLYTSIYYVYNVSLHGAPNIKVTVFLRAPVEVSMYMPHKFHM